MNSLTLQAGAIARTVCRSVAFSFMTLVLGLGLGLGSALAREDAVTEWNEAFEASLSPSTERGPRVPVRTLAIMHAAMFDAVNGIARKYEPLHVTAAAPHGASQEAAAIQAAYTVLSQLRGGANQTRWDEQLADSLAALPGSNGNSRAIIRGRSWGESVANAIIAWRATDGSTTTLPPFTGSTDPGFWRHAPLGGAPNAGYVNTVTQPFLLANASEYDPGPPYGVTDRAAALAGTAYAADVNDVEARGGVTSLVRSAEDLDLALFLDAADVASLNRMVRSRLPPSSRLVDRARFFALFNSTAFDATIVFFTAKYNHAFWRPFQSIQFADEDNNAATEKDANWQSYLVTPPHPEYPSAHVTLFSSLAHLTEVLLGHDGPVELLAAASAYHPGGTREFASLAEFVEQTVQSRVWIGYHFLGTGQVSQALGYELAEDIAAGYLVPVGAE